MNKLPEPETDPQKNSNPRQVISEKLPTYPVVFLFYGIILTVILVGNYFIPGEFSAYLFPIACVLPLIVLRLPVAPQDEPQRTDGVIKTTVLSLRDGLIVSVLILTPFLILVHYVPLFSRFSPARPMENGLSLWQSWSDVGLAVLNMLISVSLFEEIFFRGFLQDNLSRLMGDKYNFIGARLGKGWLSASALFAFPHIFSWGGNPLGLMTFFSAIVFGWLYARHRNIAGAVLCHTAFNMTPAIVDWSLNS